MRSIGQIILTVGCIAVCMTSFGACSKPSIKSVERYDNAEHISAREVHLPRHQAYVVGSVFFGAYVNGVDETTIDGGPPFSVNIGAYSLTPDSAQVTLLAAEVSIQGRQRVDILSQFSAQVFDTLAEPDQARFEEIGSYGSEWLHTGQFLKAYPSDDEGLVIYFRVRVGKGPDAIEGEVQFKFSPRVDDIPLFRLPF